MSNVALAITEGRTVRDLFENGLLEMLRARGHSVTLFTEAATVPSFVEQWRRPGQVELERLLPSEAAGNRNRAFWMRRRVGRLGSERVLSAYLRAEEQTFYPTRGAYTRSFAERGTKVVVSTHAHLAAEAELVSSARASGIPTLGVVRSWDNVHKGIRTRPDKLGVWNEINRQEVIELERYAPAEVEILGPQQFDPYFQPGTTWSRAELASRFGLDPARPIILFASLGFFLPTMDETCWMDELVALLDGGTLPGRPQIVCRLHPWSRVEQWERFRAHPDVRLSVVTRYIPTLQWWMTRDDVVEIGNLLRHADVVITPGSTITLEAAIFDRPTLVPIFHPYQPERAEEYFRTWVLGKHFRRIERDDLAPILRRREEFGPAIARALREPHWYREARRRLVEDYVGPTDGRSTERLADFIDREARRGARG